MIFVYVSVWVRSPLVLGVVEAAALNALVAPFEEYATKLVPVPTWTSALDTFAVVPMAAMKDLGIPSEKMNIWGGGISIGHPIGASGARIVVTLVNQLRTLGKKKGLAGICIGGGEATAIALEVM